jgi:hypothetical protein
VANLSRSGLVRHLEVLLLYTLLTVVLAWPVVANTGETLAGYSSDVYMNQWVDWWTRKVLARGLDIYHTDYIFYPAGTSLVFHSFSYPNTALSLLLAPLLGQVAAYNVVILLAYPLSAFAMYLLAKELTGSQAGALLAGLVYAFQPYHVFESAHPIIVSTQWMPLFVLSLRRMLRAGNAGWLAHAILSGLWFVLTALSSWHLMFMLAALAVSLLAYEHLIARSRWGAGNGRRLATVAGAIAVVLLPFLVPMLAEQLAGEAAYMAVGAEEGFPNDLASLLVPNRRHPLAPLFQAIHEDIGFSTRRPGYLGYVPLALALVGVVGAPRKTRFWWIAAVAALVASFGLRLEWRGVPLHSFELPWARPVIALLRNPFRLNVLIFFSLAILVAFGGQRVWDRLSSHRKALGGASLIALAGLTVAEYLAVPFPSTQPQYSPFVQYLAEQENTDLGVADFPMGRQPGKYYMYLQTIHERPIADGHVSRTPDDAYDFVDSNPLLAALRADAPPPPDLRLEEELSALSAQGIGYLVLHKRLPTADGLATWPLWAGAMPTPLYADEWVVAYRTDAQEEMPLEPVQAIEVHFGDHAALRGYATSATSLGDTSLLVVSLRWQSDAAIADDLHVFVHLLDSAGQLVAQHDGVPAYGTRPVSTWQPGEVVRDDHMLFLPEQQASGEYTITVGVYEGLTVERLPAVTPDGARLPDDRVVLDDVEVVLP